VGEILETVEDGLAEVAKTAQVDLVVSRWDIAWKRPGTQGVDVTREIVKLFGPDKRVWEIIEGMRGQGLVDRKTIEEHDH